MPYSSRQTSEYPFGVQFLNEISISFFILYVNKAAQFPEYHR